jgi:hypothetical protein
MVKETDLRAVQACLAKLLANGFTLNYDYKNDFFVNRDGLAVGVAVERSGRLNCDVKRWYQSKTEGKSCYKPVSSTSLPPNLDPDKVAEWVLQWVSFVS